MKTLILGGTGFFGKILAGNCTGALTASRKGDYIIDRGNVHDLKTLAENRWDVIYDQICYTATDAQIAVEAFKGKCGLYVLTSTIGVYGPVCEAASETNFIAENHYIEGSANYANGKKDAESIIATSGMRNARIRFPIVFGPHDPTMRFENFLKSVINDTPPVRNNKMSIISSVYAAKFLQWIGENDKDGPFNACDNEPISTDQILSYLSSKLGLLSYTEAAPDTKSLFNRPGIWTLDNSKAKQEGFVFDTPSDWYFKLIDSII